MTNFVLDSLPIIVFLLQQPGWEKVDRILTEASSQGGLLPISLINLGEIYYIVARALGVDRAQEVIQRLNGTPYEIVAPTYDTTLRAAEIKIGGGLSYADCFAAALALDRGSPILTDDREFERLMPFGLQIEWLT